MNAEQSDYRGLLEELLDKIQDAGMDANDADDYGRGQRAAYYDILSFALDQAAAFEIDIGARDADALMPRGPK